MVGNAIKKQKHTTYILSIKYRLFFFCFPASVLKLRGSVVNILDEITNRSVCVEFSYNLSQTVNPNKVGLLHCILLFVLSGSFEELSQ